MVNKQAGREGDRNRKGDCRLPVGLGSCLDSSGDVSERKTNNKQNPQSIGHFFLLNHRRGGRLTPGGIGCFIHPAKRFILFPSLGFLYEAMTEKKKVEVSVAVAVTEQKPNGIIQWPA